MRLANPQLKTIVAAASIAMAGLLVSTYFLKEDFHFLNALRYVKNSVERAVLDYFSEAEYDSHSRLIHYSHKSQIACPAQGPRTAVLLVIGQSNAGNHAERKYRSLYDGKIVNFFAGKCYVASSPLLGSTGIGGEPWTLLANRMISTGIADQVVLIPASIGGEPIAQWQQGAKLNTMLMTVLDEAGKFFRITAVLWHHGETDFAWQTSAEAYARGFYSMAESIRTRGVDAPIYLSVATKCGETAEWSSDNQIAAVQRALPSPEHRIAAGVDSDAFKAGDRYDHCHFSKAGQERFAESWVVILRPSATEPPEKPRN